MNREEFLRVFNVGQIVPSGGPRSKLEIHAIEADWFSVIPIFGQHKLPIRMYYSQLAAVIDGFAEIDPKRIAPTIQRVLTSRGEPKEHTTENYLYGFARAYLGDAGNLANTLPEELTEFSRLPEGACVQITINAYERHPDAKAACIARHGTTCSICSFDFGLFYGPLGEGFIHVHHLNPLSTIGKQYQLNPIIDLRPVCPNCHAIIHRRKKALTIDEVRTMVKAASKLKPEN